jgi:uncharacterized protein
MRAINHNRLEYEILEILDKRFVWLPQSLILFESMPLVEEILEKFQIMPEKDILDLYDNTTQKQAAMVLKEIKSLAVTNRRYEKALEEAALDNDIAINSIELNPIHGCNLRCKYCLAGDGSHYKDGKMAIKVAEQAVDQLIKNSPGNKVNLSFIGGEPLLNFPLMKHILKYASQKAKEAQKIITFATTVNGTLLTEEIQQTFDNYKVQAMISLDSPNKEIQDMLRPMNNGKSSFDTIMATGWKIMLGSTHKSAIRATITPYNLEFFQVAKHYYESGFQHVHVEEVYSDNEGFSFTPENIQTLKKEYEKLAQYLVEKISEGQAISSSPFMKTMETIHQRKPKTKYCGAFKSAISISPTGDYYPCDWLMWDEYNIGNLKEGLDLEKFQTLTDHFPIPVKCSKCWARYLCGGGCRVQHKNNKEKGVETDCELQLHKLKLELYIYSELQNKQPDFLDKFARKPIKSN